MFEEFKPNYSLEFIRNFISKYGEVKKWSLALKYKVLFMAIHRGADKGTTDAGIVEELYSVVCSLSQIKDSGVVETESKLKDKGWSETDISAYRCGNVEISFECYTKYSKGWIDSDWYCDIHTVNEQ